MPKPKGSNTPHFPGRPLIDAYGRGGFRFAEMSHVGSLLLLPSGVYGWDVPAVARNESSMPKLDDLARIFDEGEQIELLLLGTGGKQLFPSPEIVDQFTAARIGLEAMDSGAAARTYNVLRAEHRQVAAVLIAVL